MPLLKAAFHSSHSMISGTDVSCTTIIMETKNMEIDVLKTSDRKFTMGCLVD